MKNTTTRTIGLRWSPQPVSHYGAGALAPFRAAFQLNPAIWNLFWISAAGMEEEPLSTQGARNLFNSSVRTGSQKLSDRLVKSWAVSVMPHDFADLLENHPEQGAELSLTRLVGPHWLWLIRHRSQLFYNARVSDVGLPVPAPKIQDETNGKESTTIVNLSRFLQRK